MGSHDLVSAKYYESTVIDFELDQKTSGYLQWNRHGDTPLGFSVRAFPEGIN